MADETEVSILLLGDSLVGKSTFLSRITVAQNAPPNTPLPFLHDLNQPFVFDITPRNAPKYRLEFYDTASPTNFNLLHPSMLVLCYSIANRDTLRSVQTKWKHLVETHYNYDEHMPVLLLGLKRDLRREGDPQTVFPQEAVRIAAEMRCDRYAECSAVTAELCREAFEDIVRMAVGTTREGGGKSEGANCGVM